ncbi:hypothetical protein PENTCL1PPCAC_10239, partial [Pristionchus entomophagus]
TFFVMSKRQHAEANRPLDKLPCYINIGNFACGNFYIPESFAQHYQKPIELGTGGYGTVISLEGKKGKNIAVKRFNKAFDTAKRAQRCFRELQLLKAVSHENIVKIKFVHTTDETMESLNSVYLTAEFCGENLLFVLLQETEAKHYSLEAFQKMISELLRALKYLNSANVIHRDLKPDNLAIADNGKLTLLDFGMARVIHEKLLHTNGPGTSYFRAIETIEFDTIARINDKKRVYDEKADIWSIGAILCQMLTGEMLFKEIKERDTALTRAIEICGPVPENVIKRIDNSTVQEYLRKKNLNAERIDFLQYFLEGARFPKLRDDIEKSGDSVVDFIDRTLAFDLDARMSVDEALAHRFLKDVREKKKEVLAHPDLSIPDVDDQTIEQWKASIWDIIQESPVQFD